MPERPRRPNLDERFTLDKDPEDVLRELLHADDSDDSETEGDEDS